MITNQFAFAQLAPIAQRRLTLALHTDVSLDKQTAVRFMRRPGITNTKSHLYT
jgi:hypothetical protein